MVNNQARQFKNNLVYPLRRQHIQENFAFLNTLDQRQLLLIQYLGKP